MRTERKAPRDSENSTQKYKKIDYINYYQFDWAYMIKINEAVVLIIRESFLLILPVTLLTVFLSLSNIGSSIEVFSVLSLVLPSSFIVFSLYIPLGLNRVTEFRAEASEARRDEESEIDSIDEEAYLRSYQKRARFLLRTGLLALLSFLYPIISRLDESNILSLSSFGRQNNVLIKSFFVSVTIMISIYITYIVLSLSLEYLKFSTPGRSSLSAIDLSKNCGLMILGVFQLIILLQLIFAVEGIESGIWFAGSLIVGALIVSTLMVID